MKKILAIMLAVLLMAGALTACGGSSNGSKGEVSVLYYTFSDTYISSVRSAMDKLLKDAGVKFNDYDANGNQTQQTEQVDVISQRAPRRSSSTLLIPAPTMPHRR